MFTHNNTKGFTLVELLATIAIMAVLIVAALPYVADYTAWARSTSQSRDAQVVAGAIARWIAVGGDTTAVGTPHPSLYDWRNTKLTGAWTSGSKAAHILADLTTGWTVIPNGTRDPFMAPNTSWTALGRNIKIGFTSKTNYTVNGRTH